MWTQRVDWEPVDAPSPANGQHTWLEWCVKEAQPEHMKYDIKMIYGAPCCALFRLDSAMLPVEVEYATGELR